ncbi:MAG: AraC family transcriptional regulator [Bradyrhizobium sp.]|nr:AraC family transcriptional regulator [Bradyrhizobium sp.]
MIDVALAVSPGFQMMIVAALSVFEVANTCASETLYKIDVLSEHGGEVRSSLGMSINTVGFGRLDLDTLIVGGLVDVVPPNPDGLLEFLRQCSVSCRRVGSIGTGAFMLAEAGLLDGRRATTHWQYAPDLRARYPKIRVTDDLIYISDGPIWTSAGMTAGVDLILGMIEMDFGPELSQSVARSLVLYHRRGGGQSQRSALLEMEPKTDRIQRALEYARANLEQKLTVEVLADAARLSPRQFSRAFRQETGQTPAKAIENLRLEAARLMMEQSRHPGGIVAMETGFTDPERMRRAFLRSFGQSPQAVRRAARIEASTFPRPQEAAL